MDGGRLLALLLHERPPLVDAACFSGFWPSASRIADGFASPVDRGIAAASVADRLGFAFAAGYQAAIHALVPSLSVATIASFCVTEAEGNHPRAIHTRLVRHGDEVVLDGSKKWSTMAPEAAVLVVVATEGDGADGRPKLVAVSVPVGSPGLTVSAMPPPPFVPEILHAELVLSAVRLPAVAVLPGDGFTDYAKAFRTVEDVHVNAVVLSYLLGVGTRHRWPLRERERLVALLCAARALASLDPRTAETHVALAGLGNEVAALVSEVEPHWQLVGDAERERWYRDRALVQVASKAREQRRDRAWQILGSR